MVRIASTVSLAAFVLRGAQAFRFYTDEGCELDLNNPESDYIEFQMPEAQYGKDDDISCRVTTWSSDDWPTEGDVERKVVWLDHSDVADDCKLILYRPPTGENMDYHCLKSYITFSSLGPCSRTTLPEEFGYSYCCGSDCGNDEVGDLFEDRKRDEISQPPPVEELFEHGLVAERSVPLDPVAIKRKAPLELLGRSDECKWNGLDDSEKPYLKQLGQYRVGPFTPCETEGGCDGGEITLSYSSTVSETFGMESGVSATLFEVVSVSMSFSYSEETAEEKGYEFTYKYSVPEGARGYVAWNPLGECARGEFSGDCRGWDTDVEGEVCFLKMINGIPDGEFYLVTEQ